MYFSALLILLTRSASPAALASFRHRARIEQIFSSVRAASSRAGLVNSFSPFSRFLDIGQSYPEQPARGLLRR